MPSKGEFGDERLGGCALLRVTGILYGIHAYKPTKNKGRLCFHVMMISFKKLDSITITSRYFSVRVDGMIIIQVSDVHALSDGTWNTVNTWYINSIPWYYSYNAVNKGRLLGYR